MENVIKKAALIGLVGFVPFCSQADPHGEKTNCRNEVTEQIPIYAGQTSCTTDWTYAQYNIYTNRLTNVYKTSKLTGSTGETTNYKLRLEKEVGYNQTGVTGITEWRTQWISCEGALPIVRYQDVTSEVCDYKPVVTLQAEQFSANEVFIKLGSYDSDGTVVLKELFIDGAKQNSMSLTKFGYIGQTFHIEAIVTDNDNYTDRKSQYITIEDSDVLQPVEF
jgi:hypothetical protein